MSFFMELVAATVPAVLGYLIGKTGDLRGLFFLVPVIIIMAKFKSKVEDTEDKEQKKRYVVLTSIGMGFLLMFAIVGFIETARDMTLKTSGKWQETKLCYYDDVHYYTCAIDNQEQFEPEMTTTNAALTVQWIDEGKCTSIITRLKNEKVCN